MGRVLVCVGLTACAPIDRRAQAELNAWSAGIPTAARYESGDPVAVLPGVWVRYREDDHGATAQLTYRILDATEAALVVQATRLDDGGRRVTSFALERDGASFVVRAAAIEHEGGELEEVAADLVPLMARPLVGLLDMRQAAGERATVRVLAGTFVGAQRHHGVCRAATGSFVCDAWTHTRVPVFGVVRLDWVSGEYSLELVELGY